MFRSLFIRRDTPRSPAIDASASSIKVRSVKSRAGSSRRLVISLAAVFTSAALAIPLRAMLFAETASREIASNAMQVAASSVVQDKSVAETGHTPAPRPIETVSDQPPNTHPFIAPAAVGKVFMTLPEPYLPKADPDPFSIAISDPFAEPVTTAEAPSPILAEERPAEPIAVSNELADATGAIEVAARSDEVQAESEPETPDIMPAPSTAPLPSAHEETASAPVQKSARREESVTANWLLSRARSLIESGDISGARLVLERAVDVGDTRAAFFLAETYDPRVLATWKALGIKGDIKRARALYTQASEGGILGSKERLIDLR